MGFPGPTAGLCFKEGGLYLEVASRGITTCCFAIICIPQRPWCRMAPCLVPLIAALAEVAESLPLGSGRVCKATKASGSSARGNEAWFLPHTAFAAASVWRRNSFEGWCHRIVLICSLLGVAINNKETVQLLCKEGKHNSSCFSCCWQGIYVADCCISATGPALAGFKEHAETTWSHRRDCVYTLLALSICCNSRPSWAYWLYCQWELKGPQRRIVVISSLVPLTEHWHPTAFSCYALRKMASIHICGLNWRPWTRWLPNVFHFCYWDVGYIAVVCVVMCDVTCRYSNI